MSKINAIRLINVNYNHNAIHVSDETLHINGQSTLISLQNGGGKSVLVQLLTAPFVQKRYRNTKERPFYSYFTTTRPSFVLVEWLLENGAGHCLTGMMVRKNQNLESDENLDIISIISEYQAPCYQDIHHLPVVEHKEKEVSLKSFAACRELFESYKKEKLNKFFCYDLNNQAQSRQYFTKLAEYGIDYREWQNIIKKINEEESGLSKLFVDCKDEKGLLEKWFLDVVENKLNKDENRMQSFRSILEKYITAYSENMTKIEQREKLQKFLQELEPVQEQGEKFLAATEYSDQQLELILAYINELQRLVSVNQEERIACQEELDSLHKKLMRLAYEEYSTRYYELVDQEEKLIATRDTQQERLTELENKAKSLQRQLNIYSCARQQERVNEDELDLKQANQELDVLRHKNKELEPERDFIGYVLRQNCERSLQNTKETYSIKQTENIACAEEQEQVRSEQRQVQERLDALNSEKGSLAKSVQAYNDIENDFCKKWKVALQRNMLGAYEAGALELVGAQIAKTHVEAKQGLAKCQEKQLRLKSSIQELERRLQDLNKEINANNIELVVQKQNKASLDELLAKRHALLKYLQISEVQLFEQEKIAKALELKLAEIDSIKSKLQQDLLAVQKKQESLQTGRTLELAPELVNLLEQLGIPLVYGMEWLKKNGYDEAQNLKLVEEHPFLPYSLLMTAKDLAVLEQAQKAIFTSFPVPIIVRESLYKPVGQVITNGLLKGEKIFFLMLFNNNLLNEEKLKELLRQLVVEQEQLKKTIALRKEEYDTYQGKYEELKQQSFTKAGYNKLVQVVAELQEQSVSLQRMHDEAKQKKQRTEKDLEAKNQMIIDLGKAINRLEQQQEDFHGLSVKYKQYMLDLEHQQECLSKLQQLESRKEELQKTSRALEKRSKQILGELKDIDHKLQNLENEFNLYSSYKQVKMPKGFAVSILSDMDELKMRFEVITKKASSDLKNLNNKRTSIIKRVRTSQKDLSDDAHRFGLKPEDWYGVRYNQANVIAFTQEKEEADQEHKVTNRALSESKANLAVVEDRQKQLVRDLEKECAQSQPLPKEVLVSKDFAALRGQLRVQEHNNKELLGKLNAQGQMLRENIGALGAYKDDDRQASWQGREKFAEFGAEELRHFTTKLQKEYKNSLEQKKLAKDNLEKKLQEMQNFLTVHAMQDDIFAKSLASLQKLADTASSFLQQLNTIVQSLLTKVEKLKADLEFIEQEKQQVINLLEDYVKAVHKEMGTIDHNSTIKIRDRAVKMLELKLPVWDANASVYHISIKNLLEKFTKQGLELLQQHQPISEFLGRYLTTRNLYDEVVGFCNVKVKLYKIEAQRELAISWREVARNSGGEGFLSAFVILSSLLYYMRRDETDIFADRNEGKVLIMDNPFAQTNAAHLLMPMMDMAKKNNTQLISLTGLGGDSIYNCYDNIYVLNLVASKLSSVRYLKGKHLLGEDAEVLSLSRVEVTNEGEMPSLF